MFICVGTTQDLISPMALNGSPDKSSQRMVQAEFWLQGRSLVATNCHLVGPNFRWSLLPDLSCLVLKVNSAGINALSAAKSYLKLKQRKRHQMTVAHCANSSCIKVETCASMLDKGYELLKALWSRSLIHEASKDKGPGNYGLYSPN